MTSITRLLGEVDGLLVAIRDRVDLLAAQPQAAEHHRRAVHGLVATARTAFADVWNPPDDDHASA